VVVGGEIRPNIKIKTKNMVVINTCVCNDKLTTIKIINKKNDE
jgi:hypothetical protein